MMKNVLKQIWLIAAPLAVLSSFASALIAPNEVGRAKYLQYRGTLPSLFDVASTAEYSMSEDPKEKLVSIITSGLKETGGITSKGATESDKIDHLTNLLESQGKGFTADTVDGEWAIVFSRQSKKSPRFQKLAERKGKVGKNFSNFDIKDMTFVNESTNLWGKGKLNATLKYNTSSQGFTKDANGKIVLRRINCNIVDANFKFWKLPKLPLPFRAKGSLDFIYLDDDIRITRGNRGGLFVHFRPEYLEKVMA